MLNLTEYLLKILPGLSLGAVVGVQEMGRLLRVAYSPPRADGLSAEVHIHGSAQSPTEGCQFSLGKLCPQK